MPEQPMSFDERVARALVEDDYRQAKRMAESWSPPPNAAPTSEARELELWNQRDPSFDPQQAWAQHLQIGTDPWVARTDIALKMYPHRKALMESTRPRVREQIAYANAMAQKSARARASAPPEQPSDPYAPLPPFPTTPGPVPIPLPRAGPMPAAPAQAQGPPVMPTEPMGMMPAPTSAPPPPQGV
jgi:hypothetical protein